MTITITESDPYPHQPVRPRLVASGHYAYRHIAPDATPDSEADAQTDRTAYGTAHDGCPDCDALLPTGQPAVG